MINPLTLGNVDFAQFYRMQVAGATRVCVDRRDFKREKDNMLGFPKAYSGMTVGLLGGSFDPPHAGHVHITHQAMRRFGLDKVWWLVSPGNPIKDLKPMPIDRRIDACRRIMQHPNVEITDLETRLGTTYTADTIEQIMGKYIGVRFVWLMGADNLTNFHKWKKYEWIVENVPIGITSRPAEHVKAGMSTMAIKYSASRVSAKNSRILPFQKPPAWCLLDGPTINISSTEIRKRGDW